MPRLFKDRPLTSVKELIHLVENDAEVLAPKPPQWGPRTVMWFRGLPDADHKLVPTLHRPSGGVPVADEWHLMNRFKQNAHQFLSYRPQGEWEWMFLMRHHNTPSRLLDWTESPLIGLYFAVEDEHSDSNGALWSLLPNVLNVLGNPTLERPDVVPMFRDEGALTDDETSLQPYLVSAVSRASPPGPIRPPAAGISIRVDARMQAQRGVFTVHHADPSPLEDVQGPAVWRFIIPAIMKPSIRRELRLLGMTRLTVFPDLDSVGKEAKEGL